MKDFLVNHFKLWFILAYLFPYVFFAMRYDADCGTALMYPLMALLVGGLSWLAVKLQIIRWAVVGNILTFLSSLTCAMLFRTDRWMWYFKPFSSLGLLVLISLAAGGLQALYWVLNARFLAKKEQEESEDPTTAETTQDATAEAAEAALPEEEPQAEAAEQTPADDVPIPDGVSPAVFDEL